MAASGTADPKHRRRRPPRSAATSRSGGGVQDCSVIGRHSSSVGATLPRRVGCGKGTLFRRVPRRRPGPRLAAAGEPRGSRDLTEVARLLRRGRGCREPGVRRNPRPRRHRRHAGGRCSRRSPISPSTSRPTLVDGDRVAVLGTSDDDRSARAGSAGHRHGVPISYRLVLLFTIADGSGRPRPADLRQRRSARTARESAHRPGAARRPRKCSARCSPRTAAGGFAFYESVGHSVPCRAIGGDFFDFIDLPSGDVGNRDGRRRGQGAGGCAARGD